jgi:hypothetical protein
MSDSKNVPIERHKWTKAERQYIQGMVHNYSLQRWTDQEIVEYLWNEKKIRIGRSTVTKIKNQVEENAGAWYVELRESGYKTIAFYKERLDSLLSYQKRLNQIMASSGTPEIRVRAIAELHRIEMSLHTIFQELSQFKINPVSLNSHTLEQCKCRTITDTITHSKCRHCGQVWCVSTTNQDWCPNPDCTSGIKGCEFKPYDTHNEWLQCSTCDMWFKRKEILDAHHCAGFSTKRIPPVVGDEDMIESAAWANHKPDNVNHDDTTVKEQPIEMSKPDEDYKDQESEPESAIERYWRTHNPKPRSKYGPNNTKTSYYIS